MRVTGTVQGVGFRPTVLRVARALELVGFVRNDANGVSIELEGTPEAVDRFLPALQSALPALAHIDDVESKECPPQGDQHFEIADSESEGTVHTSIPVDTAPCADCLREFSDPQNRRYRYPFINCTACGPRYTIVRDLPYDRVRTTMDAFALCDACRQEYEDPADRRFHAEPNACPVCGPQVSLWMNGDERLNGDAAVVEAARLLSSGTIVAVKGLGGFLLACDATREESVAQLRERKHRPHKPFAVMVRDLATAERLGVLDARSRDVLLSPARPVVLVTLRTGSPLAASVAPGLAEIGLFLPVTPLQQLLLNEGPPAQVMTSGNKSDEPIARENDEALDTLAGIADAFLLHDRRIHTRADDSVVRIMSGQSTMVRRARGFVPDSIRLPFEAPPVLAVGAQLKSTICVTRGSEAFLSQHLGDLAHLGTRQFFEETVQKLGQLLQVEAEIVAHDLHPDYVSTRWAIESKRDLEPVQHHHAHVASCLAENGHTGPVIGVVFDGTGCGPDGELWGGEILQADLRQFRRLGHLSPITLPGGEAAIREPWRLAAAALIDAGESLDLLARIPTASLDGVRQMIAKGVVSPVATGAGRWFDAIAALCGVRDAITYEAQAAVELEALAADTRDSYPLTVEDIDPMLLDLRPTVRQIALDLRHGVPAPLIAGRFHETLARAITEACRIARRRTGLTTVALSGGCFQNRRLTERAHALLDSAGFRVLRHRRVPPNDGGLSLGQAAVAAWRRTHERS
jgi:hydrogenase maturation protein HypF